MDKWPEETKQNFIFHYQSSCFKENNANNSEKASLKRQFLHQILQAAQNGTSNETTCHILKTKLKEYSTVVDKPDGINNFANGVIDLIPHGINDTKKWTSEAKGSDLIQLFLKPLPGECFHKSSEGCLARKPSKTDFETFLRNKKQFSPFHNGTGMIKRPAKLNAASTTMPGINSEKSLNQLSLKAPGPSTLVSSIGARVFGSAKEPQQPQPKLQPNPSFRTAGTELRLQNAKKNASDQTFQRQNQDGHNYGSGKRSLGGRTRSVNSKFVPPIKSNSQEDVNSQPNTCEEEVDDERLRLIDPKLVELIRSEIMDHGPPVAWDDIAGLHFAKATIQEIVVLPMLRPDIFTGLRRPPKGILLFGPPGTGKTLIGKCIASQSNSTFFNISASSLTSKWVGEGEKMVRTLFTLARVHQPAVVFIDEIDSLLSQRSDSEHESSRRIKTEFLVQLDGAGTGEDDRILVIGATNRPKELDEAARRRLVKRLYIPLPDHQARCHIIERLMTAERNVLTSGQIEDIASLTEGFSGADMKNVCQEACLGPIRSLTFSEMQHIAPDQVRPVTVEDFTTALTRVRSSVSPDDLEAYVTWDKTYGSGGAPK